MLYLPNEDPEFFNLVNKEENRLENTLNLIAAENHCPQSVNEGFGSGHWLALFQHTTYCISRVLKITIYCGFLAPWNGVSPVPTVWVPS